MSTLPKSRTAALTCKIELEIFVGRDELPVGQLVYVKSGQREFSQFAYNPGWLAAARAFDISPDLQCIHGFQARKAPGKDDSCFFHTLADSEPDALGRRVIARAHAKTSPVWGSLFFAVDPKNGTFINTLSAKKLTAYFTSTACSFGRSKKAINIAMLGIRSFTHQIYPLMRRIKCCRKITTDTDTR